MSVVINLIKGKKGQCITVNHDYSVTFKQTGVEMGTESWNVQVYSNEQKTLFGYELWAKSKKIYESECAYSKEDAMKMAEELKTKFGIKE